VQRGNEYVIASRSPTPVLSSPRIARNRFEQWNEKLENVVFQAKLGDKAKDIGQKIAGSFRSRSRSPDTAAEPGFTRNVVAAASMSKADLASGTVASFPELRRDGEYYAL